jgi:hypothetical protein
MVFREPRSQRGCGSARERGDSFPAALASAADVRRGAEVDVAAGQPGQLRCAQTGLDGEEQQRVIASSRPCGAVGRREQRLDFVL